MSTRLFSEITAQGHQGIEVALAESRRENGTDRGTPISTSQMVLDLDLGNDVGWGFTVESAFRLDHLGHP